MVLDETQLKTVSEARAYITVLEAKMVNVNKKADAAIKSHSDAIASIETQRSTALATLGTRIDAEQAKINALIDSA